MIQTSSLAAVALQRFAAKREIPSRRWRLWAPARKMRAAHYAVRGSVLLQECHEGCRNMRQTLISRAGDGLVFLMVVALPDPGGDYHYRAPGARRARDAYWRGRDSR
jgi:hypothetical protein